VRDTLETSSLEKIRETKKEMDNAITRQASLEIQIQGGGNIAEIKKGMIDAQEHTIERFGDIDKRLIEIGATKDLGLEKSGDAIMEGVEHNKKNREEIAKDKEHRKVDRRRRRKAPPDMPAQFDDWVESDISRFGELMVEFFENRERVCDAASKELNKEKAKVYDFYDSWVKSEMGSELISIWKKKMTLARKEKESREKIGGWMHSFVRLQWNTLDIQYDMFRYNTYSLREDRFLIYCMQLAQCDFDEVCRYIKHHYKLRHEIFLQSRTKDEIMNRGTYLLDLLKKQFDKT
jgi:hypothetical protein